MPSRHLRSVFFLLFLAPIWAQSSPAVEEMLRQGRFDEALAELERADPQSASTHHWAAQAWEGLGELPRAAAAARKALDLEPQNEAFRLHLGRLFLVGNNPGAALEIFEEAIEAFPDNPYLRLGAGLALNQLHRYEEAEALLEPALEQAPSLGLALDSLVEAYVRQTKLQDAAAAAATYLEANPTDYRGYYQLAVVEEKRGAPPARIEELLREALARDGLHAPAHALLGKTLLQLGREQEAVLSLEGAARLDPTDPVARMHLARAYRAVGRADDARREAAIVKELGQRKEALPVLRRREEPR